MPGCVDAASPDISAGIQKCAGQWMSALRPVLQMLHRCYRNAMRQGLTVDVFS